MAPLSSCALLASLSLRPAEAHDNGLSLNPELGVTGFIDNCFCRHPHLNLSSPEASENRTCEQRRVDGAVKIGCVGDSITAGFRSSSDSHSYPQQLQVLLDAAHGKDAYSVTNLGECGAAMQKSSNKPYWKGNGYQALTSNTWDIVVIMLGTNDAKDPLSHDWQRDKGADNWQQDCANGESTRDCRYATDFKAMIDVVRTLGTTPEGPKIYAMVPPPLMQQGEYGMNQTLINDFLPKLLPLIEKESGIDGLINVFAGMGGVPDWRSKYPSSCQKDTSDPASCKWFCNGQSCDQCHPNDDGYTHLAEIVQAGLGLSTSAPVVV